MTLAKETKYEHIGETCGCQDHDHDLVLGGQGRKQHRDAFLGASDGVDHDRRQVLIIRRQRDRHVACRMGGIPRRHMRPVAEGGGEQECREQ